MRYARLIAPLLVLLVACGGESGSTTTSLVATTPPTTGAPASTTTSAPTTTTTTANGTPVLPLALDHMPDTWEEVFFIPYGETEDTLGVSLGGDGEGIWWGPEYGAQAPDGTWWFLDTANFRVAHFSEDGEYLDQVVVPESMLVNGVYFQYTQPRVLADGTVLAARLSGLETNFLRIRDGAIDEFGIPYEMTPRFDDGTTVFGFSFGEDSTPIAVDPVAETGQIVEWFVGRTGDRFGFTGGAGGLGIELPDASPPVSLVLDFEAAEIGGPAYLTIEVASGEDGTLHLFLLGFPERDESLQLAGYLTISPDGEVSPVEPMMDPFTSSDPGTPARLGVRPGTSQPWYMNIGTEGVTVFVRR